MRALDERGFEEVSRYFAALAVPARLKILDALREGERNVTDLTEVTGCAQANVSKHLAVLAQSAMVDKSQRGTSVYYRIADPRIYRLCELVCGRIAERYGEQAARRRKFVASARPR